MAKDFRSARFWAQQLMEEALFPGAVAIDATMGNGHDTLWLCERVGETGRVFAFDVQSEALESTKKRLDEAGVLSRAQLFLLGHEHMAEVVHAQADAIMFNLGWLPGVAQRKTTMVKTTIPAANAALSLLKDGGLLTICAYPGHDEGSAELEALLDWAAALDPAVFDAMTQHYLNQPNHPPQMFAIRKRPAARAKK